MLERVPRPSAYACAMVGDDVAAVGRAVADTGWAGVFGMATRPAARGKGAARQVLAALAGWAGAHGAGRMYLQVERDNGPVCGCTSRRVSVKYAGTTTAPRGEPRALVRSGYPSGGLLGLQLA